LLQNPHDNTRLTLGILLHYVGKLKIQIFCRCGRKRKQTAFLIVSNFVIYPQILIFSVLKILSILTVNKFFRCHCSFTYLLLPSISAHAEENIETVNDLVQSQENKPQTHRTVREIPRETGIHRSSLSQIICNDLHLKCFKRRRAQAL